MYSMATEAEVTIRSMKAKSRSLLTGRLAPTRKLDDVPYAEMLDYMEGRHLNLSGNTGRLAWGAILIWI